MGMVGAEVAVDVPDNDDVEKSVCNDRGEVAALLLALYPRLSTLLDGGG